MLARNRCNSRLLFNGILNHPTMSKSKNRYTALRTSIIPIILGNMKHENTKEEMFICQLRKLGMCHCLQCRTYYRHKYSWPHCPLVNGTPPRKCHPSPPCLIQGMHLGQWPSNRNETFKLTIQTWPYFRIFRILSNLAHTCSLTLPPLQSRAGYSLERNRSEKRQKCRWCKSHNYMFVHEIMNYNITRNEYTLCLQGT